MAFFVVKGVEWLLGRIHGIFCGEECCVVLGGIASIFRGEEYCVVVIKNTWHNFVLNVVVWL